MTTHTYLECDTVFCFVLITTSNCWRVELFYFSAIFRPLWWFPRWWRVHSCSFMIYFLIFLHQEPSSPRISALWWLVQDKLLDTDATEDWLKINNFQWFTTRWELIFAISSSIPLLYPANTVLGQRETQITPQLVCFVHDCGWKCLAVVFPSLVAGYKQLSSSRPNWSQS